ncbi:hypothetical protein [Rhodococcus sp. NPDC058521]|uniref:hypothetical protein n=1 Tax=Rhodococcus sp. NPDC058521 TaxID=3346536 RepID=UPI003656B117
MQPIQDQAPQQVDTPNDAAQPVQPAPAPKSKRGLYALGGVAVLAAAAIAVGFVAFGGNDTADSPAERLSSAVDQTFQGPMRVTSVKDGAETTAQIDHSEKTVYTDSPASGPAGAPMTTFLRDDDFFIRFGQESPGVEAGKWYRMPMEGQGMGSMLTKAFDAEFIALLLDSAQNVEEAGPDTVEGIDTTRYVVTMDKDAVVDMTLDVMKGDGDGELPEEMRTGMAAMLPDTTQYWVDESGKLIQEDDGEQVKRYHDFGVPLDLPEIDESAVEPMPFG